MSRDSISVVIVCHNEGELLQRALDSVFAQSDQDFELVVVKNASTCEETLRICRGLEGRRNVKVVFLPNNKGNLAARNVGFKVASGAILVPLDGDDTLPSHVVATTSAEFRLHPEADFVFGDYVLRNVDTGETRLMDCSMAADEQGWLIGRRFADGHMFIGSSPLRKKTWSRVGGCRGSMFGWQDVDFWMTVIGSGAKGHYVKKTLYEWHRQSTGVNANTPEWRLWEVHLRNRRFHRQVGGWEGIVEGFLDYADERYEKPEARHLMQRQGWRLFPLPNSLWGQYTRVLIKCVVPLPLWKRWRHRHPEAG